MPGSNCSVKGCKNYTLRCRQNNISFHAFPKDPDLKKGWIEFCQQRENWVPKPHSKICSAHFERQDYELSFRQELLNVPTIPKLNRTAAPSIRASKCEEKKVEEIVLEYSDSDGQPEVEFESVDVDGFGYASSSEETASSQPDESDESQEKPLADLQNLRGEVANLKRKTEEQEQTIRKVRALNECLAKDLHNERHRNLYLKNKLNLLQRELATKSEFPVSGAHGSQDRIVIIVSNEEKDEEG